ncbi:MAG TPA: hypothetical protein VFD91_09270 [Mariniphaga sp.]|nr:hypothetical protein [Mariniphaga sp.]
MKKATIIILLFLTSICVHAQSAKKVVINKNSFDISNHFERSKQRGYYSIMQINLLLGSNQFVQRMTYYPYPSYHSYSLMPVENYNTQSQITVSPSFTMTHGYLFNEHWAAGAGIGFEIFDHNLFPLFAELRYTLWDDKISPFVTMKGGYSLGNFKMKHYEEVYVSWSPYHVNDAGLRHYGGRMLNPEVGVKIPLNENSDLMFTAAYRHQKTKSAVRKEYDNGQFDEWEHKDKLSRISFGVAIMFR